MKELIEKAEKLGCRNRIYKRNNNEDDNISDYLNLCLIQKWLRDEKGTEVFAKSEYYNGKSLGFYYGGDLGYSSPKYETYEQALEQGILNALKELER